ncbi:DNA-binding transcriptional MerR regulator [Rhizomicrobium palustre]|uniref:DNA-binding transcriptional MerR regulator n=1 Tax=Rhizomicrobium palustre TaxID=189966 RepID=A0A846N1F0_9PROT|nr:MerR family transcriptional regulator [Rhizomicrobium palustre]NIK89794.1 DNA-binding transcriptional MerR regulator [Rhizomicrobium palustre]
MSLAVVAGLDANKAASVKSPEAFRTISEVSVELDVPQHVLRFWESRFSQIKPTKRAGGRRYYRPEDVDLLRGIRSLLYSDGYTIKGVQKLLREKGARFVADVGRQSLVPAAPRPKKEGAVLAFRRGRDLAEEEREKLEILLAELVQLKARLRQAPRFQF